MILLEGVTKAYAGFPILRGVDLVVGTGEFIAVMGSSGSGKSTLLNLIGGIDRPDSGRIVVSGEDLTAYADDRLTRYRRQKVGFIFQFFNLLPNITVFENVEMPLLLDRTSDGGRVAACLERIGLADKAGRYPYELSGGEQQRVAIARALVHRPAIILADEPTGSLDSASGKRVMELLCSLVRESGTTVVLVTHEEQIARYADGIVRISDGVLRR